MLTILLSLAGGLPIHAQQSAAALNGIVRDTAGSVVPDAQLVLANVDTGVERRTVSNATGNYVFLNIPPGAYTLQTETTGFETNRIQRFTLAVNQTATIDIALTIGSLTQSVSVQAIGVEIQASTAELGTVMASTQVRDLPLNGRNFTQLLNLSPGVSDVNVAQNSNGNPAAAVGTFSFPSINGQPNRSNLFTTDGINNYGSSSTYSVPPIAETIQEFKMQSHNDQAEFGGATGGIVNVVTKSGTNSYRGSLWEYVRNNAFDAENYFHANSPVLKQNMFGGTLGGPVALPKLYDGHNKTFFYAAYQGFLDRRPANTTYRVPTTANLTGDFSDWPQQIYDPYSTRPDPNKPGSYLRDAFPGNQIPANRLNQSLVKYAQATLPQPTNIGIAGKNAIDLSGARINNNEFNARLDENWNEKNYFWFRYSGRLQDTTTSGGRQGLVNNAQFDSANWGGSWVHTFNASTLLQTQFGRTHAGTTTLIQFTDLPANYAQSLGFAEALAGPYKTGLSLFPALNVTGFFTGGEQASWDQQADIYQGKIALSKVIGAHTLKFGFEFNSLSYAGYTETPSVTFNNIQSANPSSTGNTGSALASFLLDTPDAVLRRDTLTHSRFGGVMSLFAQDQWKVTQRLTVNIGLRYDRAFVPPYGTEADGTLATGSLDLNRGVYILQALPEPCETKKSAPCIPTAGGVLPDHVELSPNGKIIQDTTKNFQPRIGIAYRLGPNTALRSSFGVFFDEYAGIIQASRNYQGSWPDIAYQQQTNLNYPTATQTKPSVSTFNPFPGGAVLPASTPFNQVAYFPDPNYKNPYSLQWNLGIEHQIDASNIVSLNYVGSGNRRLDLGGFYNTALTPGPGTPQSRALYPYIKATNYNRSWSRSNYNALQTQWQKRFAHGLAATLSYTWSKSIDIGCSGWFGVEGCSVQDPYNFNNDRSVSGFDVPHVFTGHWVWELPFGTGKPLHTGNRAADYVIGNWQLNGIVTLRSGQPYTLTVNGDIANTGNTNYMRPNVVGDWHVDNPNPNQWFDQSAFAAPSQYTFGNMGRNVLRTDGRNNFDLSVFRGFPIREQMKLEFRAEAFNAFNTPDFNAPVSNLNDPNFGKVTSVRSSRQLQFALRLMF
ncbi:carboxypeptidase regulatory-like domain-containing protein [uncultured Paludibaculum sp.]|uniref:TonB-dependent receptor n=1 Tax=uncultured Paludibaculum sp. TaxID=1765020 RepID=UPI002AAB72F2|nr:carboxypeptidase regulatory-like domain-containing protein [uncultured Paludibaculum sp.]